MRFYLLILSLFIPGNSVFSQTKRHHHAHEHGKGELAIAVAGKTAEIEFESPAESVYGFEHKAKTEAEKKAIANADKKIGASLETIVQFPKTLTCTYQMGKIELEEEGGHDHSEVEVSYKVTCDRDIKDVELKFGLSALFPKLKAYKVKLLSDQKQEGLDVKNDKGSLKI